MFYIKNEVVHFFGVFTNTTLVLNILIVFIQSKNILSAILRIRGRGVESVGLIASDGLTGIENAIAKSLPIREISAFRSTFETHYIGSFSENKKA